jgi:hypothetical protein
MTLAEKLEQAIAAAEAGRKVEARTLLAQVVEADEAQTEAWWWLGQLSDSLDDKQICFENILALEPDHAEAQAALAWVQEQRARLYRGVYTPGQEAPPAQVVTHAPDPGPFSRDYPDADDFDNPWRCPTAWASPNRRYGLPRLPEIAHSHHPPPHRALGLAVARYCAATGADFADRGHVGYLFHLKSEIRRAGQTARFSAALLWPASGQPPEVIAEIFLRYPPWLFWSFAAVILYSILMILMLYFRMKHGNTIYLISAGLLLSFGLLTILLSFGDFTGGCWALGWPPLARANCWSR